MRIVVVVGVKRVIHECYMRHASAVSGIDVNTALGILCAVRVEDPRREARRIDSVCTGTRVVAKMEGRKSVLLIVQLLSGSQPIPFLPRLVPQLAININTVIVVVFAARAV